MRSQRQNVTVSLSFCSQSANYDQHEPNCWPIRSLNAESSSSQCSEPVTGHGSSTSCFEPILLQTHCQLRRSRQLQFIQILTQEPDFRFPSQNPSCLFVQPQQSFYLGK